MSDRPDTAPDGPTLTAEELARPSLLTTSWEPATLQITTPGVFDLLRFVNQGPVAAVNAIGPPTHAEGVDVRLMQSGAQCVVRLAVAQTGAVEVLNADGSVLVRVTPDHVEIGLLNGRSAVFHVRDPGEPAPAGPVPVPKPENNQ